MEATSAPRPLAARIPVPRRVLGVLSDERLVDHVRAGDAAAFEVLYDRHHAAILAFCRHMLGSASDAEDAVQHAFIAAHSDLQRRGDRELHFKAWLYTIARNRCLSMLRSRREQSSDDIEIVTDRLSDDVQERDDLRALLLDIRKLPEDQREALVLSEVGDLSHVEVAEVIGCEASKVKSLVFQARTSLLDRRKARETPCQEIREQISTLRGGALRRSHLRHHLESCPGCSEFREQVRRQRAMLALALPVIPSVGLKSNVLAAVGTGASGVAAAGSGAAGGLAIAVKSGAAKLGIVAVLAGGAGTGAVVANNGALPLIGDDTPPAPKSTEGSGGQNGGPGQPGLAGASGDQTGKSDAKESGPQNRSEAGKEHGFTPTTGASNGEAARDFAQTRGKGKKKGLAKSRANSNKRARPVPKRKRTRPRPTPPTVPKARTRTSPTQTSPTRTTTAPTATAPAPAPEIDATTAPAETQATVVPDATGDGGSQALGGKTSAPAS